MFALSLSGALACTGTVGGSGESEGATAVQPTTLQAGDDIRAARLGHLQWARTVQSFFKLTDTPSTSLRPDPPPKEGYTTDVHARSVDRALVVDYRTEADRLVEALLADSTNYVRFTAEAGAGDFATMLKRLVISAWPRALRHPLSDAEVAKYVAFGTGAPGVAQATDDAAKLRAALLPLLSFTLQSPQFVYQIALGDEATAVTEGSTHTRQLTPLEYLTRVSYALRNAPPNAEEFAKANTLTSDVARAALVDAMLAEPGTNDAILEFHRALYLVDASRTMPKDPAAFPGMDGLGADAATEAEMFLNDVLVTNNGGLDKLLLSPTTFVNKRLAGVYGLNTDGLSDTGFAKRELPAERAGILTRVSWTGLKANQVERSSILRGVYLTKNLLCTPIGVNPPLAGAVLPAPTPGLVTDRELTDDKTRSPQCSGCHHTTINPLGFAFGNFNAIGKFVTLDHDKPVLASGKVAMDGTLTDFGDAVAFLKAASRARQTHACYVGNLSSFFLGRTLTERDRKSLAATAAKSLTDSTPTRQLLKDIVLGAAFRSVVQEDVK